MTFAEYLDSNGLSVADVAESLEIGIDDVIRYREGLIVPTSALKVKIKDYTKGAVIDADWRVLSATDAKNRLNQHLISETLLVLAKQKEAGGRAIRNN